MLHGWVALTGTPGVGKTAIADLLRRRGVPTVDLARFAHDFDLVEAVDPARTSAIVDPRRVAPMLRRVTQRGSLCLLDGHWSHEVPGTLGAVVVRLDPEELRSRLERRGWPPPKVRENVDAEAIDLILQEAVQRFGRDRVREVDATGRGPDSLARDVHGLLRESSAAARAFRPGRVDWSGYILDQY